MFFNISGYIIDINQKKIIIRIIDEDLLIKFQKNINKLYKVENDINLENNIYTFHINKNTKFIISNFTYNNLLDLKGIYITLSGYSKYYCFQLNNDNILNEINNEIEEQKNYKKGYIYIINKIYN